MKEKFAKLINIKSIVTILLTMVFCYLSIVQVIPAELFMTVFTYPQYRRYPAHRAPDDSSGYSSARS